MGHHGNETLCLKCAWVTGCAVYSEASSPITACRTFYSQERYQEANHVASSQPDPSRAAGLCVDCENRASCVFRKREGGTWHCEEYC